jgi:hypothetical protein
MKDICTFGVQKSKNRPPEPKNEIWFPKTEFGAQNQYGRVVYPSIGHFTRSKKKLGVKKVKISLQSPKAERPKKSKKKITALKT